MKTPALLTLLLAALLAALPAGRARAQEASFDLFYNSLADDGDWYNTPDFGYVWHPAIADGSAKWRPYTDGYWAQTDDGWAWVSYESFGWATYHYGRWTRLENVGWVWVPGYQWGPGWVSWRTSEQYVGWAPLPPREERTGQAVSVDYNTVEAVDDGYTAAVDADYDIGPDNYCFVGVRQFGAPVLSEVILPPLGNLVIFGNTINVTNIYYRRGPERTVVYNTGPDFAFISAHVERPIQRLRINRREDITYLRENGHGGNPTVVKNGVLFVAAPVIARRAVNFEQIKPVRVKQIIAQPQIVHGWSNAGDPAQVALLRTRVKTQTQGAPRQARADLPPQGLAPAPEPELRERAPVPATGQLPPRVTGANPPVKAVTAPVNDPNTVRTQNLKDQLARKKAQAQDDVPRQPAVSGPGKVQTLTPEEERIVHQPARPAATPAPVVREVRQEIKTTPAPHAVQPPPQGEPNERDQRRPDHQQKTQTPPPQTAESGAAQAAQERAARRAERQQAPPSPAQGNAKGEKGDEKKKPDNN